MVNMHMCHINHTNNNNHKNNNNNNNYYYYSNSNTIQFWGISIYLDYFQYLLTYF